MSGRGSAFRSIRNLTITVAVLQTAAIICYSIGVSGLVWKDQLHSQWRDWSWLRYAISQLFPIPLLISMLVWMTHSASRTGFVYLLHIITCWAFVGWGAVHIGWSVIDLTNCNESTGITKDVPWCSNPNYPADTSPSFSFFLASFALVGNVICTFMWTIFNNQLKNAALGGGISLSLRTGKKMTTAATNTVPVDASRRRSNKASSGRGAYALDGF